MPNFTPLRADGSDIVTVALTDVQLLDLRSVVIMALDHNPATPAFREAMAPARDTLGDTAFQDWLVALQQITTPGETAGSINFALEDWITVWRIADFIDRIWVVARIDAPV